MVAEETQFELFVPGRVCLLGEYADYSGGQRIHNQNIDKGLTIITPIDHGIYARIKKRNDNNLRVKSTLQTSSFVSSIDPVANLLERANQNTIFNYIAGTAYFIANRYEISGLDIDNYKTTLPIKAGLASSASICVLTVKAFNEAYNLGIDLEGQMELAYLGETLTFSKCGRMDQACVYPNPVMMTFDGDSIDLEELSVGKDFHLVLVNLKKGKDTIRILSDVFRVYPFARTEIERKVHNYLGPLNTRIVLEARKAIREGDATLLGKLMNEAQRHFDETIAPLSDELKAPKLHQILSYEPVQHLMYGGKGVGSQGDGSAQILATGKEEQQELIDILQKDYKIDVDCFELNIKRSA